jgi:tape measure domain-containing protein
MATTKIGVDIGINVDNGRAIASINSVKTAFDGVAGAASKADTAGALPNTQRQLSAIKGTLATFRQALVAYAALRVIGSLVGNITRQIDAFTLLDARVKAATGSTAKAIAAYKSLTAISRETAVPIADLANFFARTADSVLLYGDASASALELTRSVALGLKASGASAAESASAFLQFSQAINSGKLSGEEFRAVYEAAPRLIQAYARALGISAGRLYEQSKAQQLTTDRLINVTQQVNKILAAEAAKVPATIASSVESVKNAFGQVLAQGANVSGLVNTISGGLAVLAKNADLVVAALLGLTGGVVIGGLGLLTAELIKLAKAASAGALGATALANPLAALAAAGAIGAGIAIVYRSIDRLGEEAQDASAKAKDLEGNIKKLSDALGRAEINLVDARKALKDFDREQSVEGLKKRVEEANEAIRAQKNLVDALRDAWTGALAKAAAYRDKADEIRKTAVFSGLDRKRSGLSEEAAQLDASIEYGNNYLKLQRNLIDIQRLREEGDLSGAQKLAEESEILAKRQESLIDQLKASDAESASRRIADQTAKLYEALAEIEEAQAKVTGERAQAEEGNLENLKVSLEQLKQQIDDIKDTDLALKRVTLVDQLDAAIAKVDEWKGKIDALNAPSPTPNAVGFFNDQPGLQDFQQKSFLQNLLSPDKAFEDAFQRGKAQIEQQSKKDPIELGWVIDPEKAEKGVQGVFAGLEMDVPATVDDQALRQQAAAVVLGINQSQAVPPIVVPVVTPSVGMTEDGRPIYSATQAFAAGGPVKPPNAFDNLLGWFNRDEFIMRAAAVRKYGAGFMDSINSLAFPKVPAYAAGGPVGTPVNLYLPDGRSFGMSAAPSVARELTKILSTEVLKRGRR